MGKKSGLYTAFDKPFYKIQYLILTAAPLVVRVQVSNMDLFIHHAPCLEPHINRMYC